MLRSVLARVLFGFLPWVNQAVWQPFKAFTTPKLKALWRWYVPLFHVSKEDFLYAPRALAVLLAVICFNYVVFLFGVAGGDTGKGILLGSIVALIVLINTFFFPPDHGGKDEYARDIFYGLMVFLWGVFSFGFFAVLLLTHNFFGALFVFLYAAVFLKVMMGWYTPFWEYGDIYAVRRKWQRRRKLAKLRRHYRDTQT